MLGRLACGEPSFTPTLKNHTCGELEGSAFIVTTHLFYAFRQRFSFANWQSYWQSYTRNQRVWDWVRVGMAIFVFDTQQ